MYYIGIDLGGTNIACGIVDVNGKLISDPTVLHHVSWPLLKRETLFRFEHGIQFC